VYIYTHKYIRTYIIFAFACSVHHLWLHTHTHTHTHTYTHTHIWTRLSNSDWCAFCLICTIASHVVAHTHTYDTHTHMDVPAQLGFGCLWSHMHHWPQRFLFQSAVCLIVLSIHLCPMLCIYTYIYTHGTMHTVLDKYKFTHAYLHTCNTHTYIHKHAHTYIAYEF
jgi:hypothetical protein